MDRSFRVLVALLIGLAAAPEQAQDLRLPGAASEFEAFFDGLLPALMASYHVPSAVVIVVRDGEIHLAKGYGFAEVEARRPVDPDTTVFRLASISKLVSAAAALQLVDHGKLAFDTDVDEYLEQFEIEAAFDQPVTLHHLLTHTAGFDDRFFCARVIASVTRYRGLPAISRTACHPG